MPNVKEVPKETMELLEFVFKLSDGVKLSLEDGKWSWVDSTNFIPALIAVFPAIGGIERVDDELFNMTPEQKDELVEWFKSRYDVDNEFAEAAVENGLAVALDLLLYIKKYFVDGPDPE